MCYFSYDSIYGHIKKYNKMDMLIHHIISFSGILWCYINNKYGQEMIQALAQAEMTGIMFNLSTVLKMNGLSGGLTFKLDLLFLVTFIIMRPTFCYNTMANIQLNKDTDIVYKLIPTGVVYISLDWCWMMINKASKLIYEVRNEEIYFFLG